jgi:methenyltetrahydrofolate cyclohydrolase
VASAYQLPRPAEGRSAAIAAALAGAARPPADVVRLAPRLIQLATSLLEAGNRNVITDVGAAAEAARAAAVTARLNIEVNARGITDAALRDELAETALVADAVAEQADAIVAAVRAEIAR